MRLMIILTRGFWWGLSEINYLIVQVIPQWMLTTYTSCPKRSEAKRNMLEIEMFWNLQIPGYYYYVLNPLPFFHLTGPVVDSAVIFDGCPPSKGWGGRPGTPGWGLAFEEASHSCRHSGTLLAVVRCPQLSPFASGHSQLSASVPFFFSKSQLIYQFYFGELWFQMCSRSRLFIIFWTKAVGVVSHWCRYQFPQAGKQMFCFRLYDVVVVQHWPALGPAPEALSAVS